MEGLDQNTSQMISLAEARAIARDLNGLVPQELRRHIIGKAAKNFRRYFRDLGLDLERLAQMAGDGSILITTTGASYFSTEGQGELEYSWLAANVEENELAAFPEFSEATFGVLLIDNRTRGFLHSTQEGRRRFAVIRWHEGQRLDRAARGEFLLTGTTSLS